MFLHQISFLFNRKPDGKEVFGTTAIHYETLKELRAATDEDRKKLLEDEGYDVVRIIQPGENVIGVNFGEWDF